jgi:CheY-like chemotaxis protein
MTVEAPPIILIVEDNPITRKLLRVTLESARYVVVEAADGRTALAAAEAKMPALVVQDLVLPDIDGFELAVQLRALPNGGAALPIVALSGLTGAVGESQIARGGFNAMLLEPAEPSRILESIAPFLAPPFAPLLPTSRPLVAIGNDRRVLVVDDDGNQLKLMRIHLRELGFSVSVASSATEALRLAHKSVPDIILSDILMPDVDGFQLCFEVRRSPRLGKVPVLLLSAYYQTEADRELARRVGASAFILRTPTLDEVGPAILHALEEGTRPLGEEPSDAVKLAHAKAVVRQLERQVAVSAGLARRSTLQGAQLSLLGGIAAALARKAEFDVVLRDVLAATLDAAGLSKGALLFETERDGSLALRHAIGFSDSESAALQDLFGEMGFLAGVVAQLHPMSVPSAMVPEAVATQILVGAGVAGAEIVPLVSENRGIGAIVLGAQRTDVTSEDSVPFARAIGNHIVQSLELEQSFRRLAESEQRYRTLMDRANDGIFILNAEGVIHEVNRRFEEIIGLPKDDIVGRPIGDFVPAARDRAVPVKMVKADGAVALIEFSETPVDVGPGQLIFSIARDVSDQVRANAQLMVSDRMASIGMMAAGVAHEINNPLAVVIGNLDIAATVIEGLSKRLRPVPDLADLADVLRDGQEAAARVRGIVQDLKLFSRAEEERRVAVDVHRVLDSALRMARAEIQHRARLLTDYGRLPRVLANESRLGQVFLNLVVNAAQAIPEGQADFNEIRIRTYPIDGEKAIVVEVSDTGSGIAPEVIRKLFTPFFTTKPQGIGTGLGLAICQRIVTALGGEITITSEVGKGTVVRVMIPAGETPEDEARSVARVQDAPRRGRILVVDDEAPVAAVIRRALAREHEVQVLTSATEAFRRLDGGERYDVILCDLMMPVMTGMEFHAELTRTVPDQAACIIFLTGGAFTAGARKFLDQVPNPRLEKPFQIQALRSLVNERLH